MVDADPRPRVSVVIATHNWSAAVRCAVESVLLQTFTDFEVLVVGDACTDDTEAAVAAFDDPRVSFYNLNSRCGSQWAPNNFALSKARGDYVAYLGHDDVWWPDHLASSLAVMSSRSADVTAALTLFSGPPESGVYGVTGLFPEGRFQPAYFFVPSSMMHRRDLIDRVGLWRPVEEAGLPTDVDFVRRCHAAGARIMETGELTVFKFNSAWRRNAYLDKLTAEQETVLAHARKGDDFRNRELVKALRAVIEDRFVRIEDHSHTRPSAVEEQINARMFKGSVTGPEAVPVSALEEAQTFPITEGYEGFEWYGLEHNGAGRAFRWSGPSRKSSVQLPLIADAAVFVEVLIVQAVAPAALDRLRISVNGEPISCQRRTSPDGWVLTGLYWPRQFEDARSMLVTFEAGRTVRPIDLRLNEDRRWLGVAVAEIKVSPLALSKRASGGSAIASA